MKAQADASMTVETEPYNFRNPLGGWGQASGRGINVRVSTLAMTGMLMGEQKYIDKAVSITLAAASQTDAAFFNVLNEHLAVADGAHAYAMAYDWLWPWLNPAQRELLRAEVEEFGQWLYDYSMTGRGYGNFSPVPLSCNHNAVHHGALGLCALALGDRTEWLARSVKFVEGYFKYARDDTGYNYEGLGYYGYGSWGAMTFCEALRRAGGPDLAMADPKNRLIPRYVLYQMAPWGKTLVPMNDSGDRIGSASGLMCLIARNQDRVGLWTWLRILGPEGNGSYGPDRGGGTGDGASIPYTLLFADPELKPLSPEEAGVPTHMFFTGGRGSFRSGWGPLDAMATFTCGFDQHRGHNQKDENSFTLYARGEKFVIDPGYHPWETRSHNCILVDGIGQGRDGDAYDVYGKTVDTKDFGEARGMTGDAADAYLDAAGVGRARRHFLFVAGENPYVVLADDVQKTSGDEGEYTWLLHTDRANTMTLGADGLTADIHGGARKALCRVQFQRPLEGLKVFVNDLTGEKFPARWGDYAYSRYYHELRATIRAVNPRFVAIIAAADSEEQLPRVESETKGEDIQMDIRLPGGGAHRVTLTRDGLQFAKR